MNSSPSADPATQSADGGRSALRKTLVMTATYNEIENLPRLVEDVFRVVPDVDFLVIDDNSPDGTGRWCDEQAATNKKIHCLQIKKYLLNTY